MRTLLARLDTGDVAVFGYAAVTAVLILLNFPRLPDAPQVLAAHLGFTAVAAATIACAARFPGRGWAIARDWYPLLIVPAAFRELYYLVPAVHPHDRDSMLIAWDRALFGAAPTVALERLLHPVAVEVLQLCYASYYFLPIVLGLVLYRPGTRDAFRESLALIVLGFFTSYLGYFAVPALPPSLHEEVLGHARPWATDPAAQGFGLAPRIRETLAALEWKMRDCFPSGHAEVTLIALACAWRFHRATFWGLLGPAIGLIFATVYLRYHYAVDVMAGAVFAAAVLWGGPKLHRAWNARRAGLLKNTGPP